MTGEELLRKCINKDHVAWNEFVKCYKFLVTQSVKYKIKKFGKCLAKNEIADIVQEIFIDIWEQDKLRNIRSAKCLEAWLVIVSINFTTHYYNRYIARQAHNTISLNESVSCEDTATQECFIPSLEPNAEDIFFAKEQKNILLKKISKLKPKEKSAIKLNLYKGKKQREIARIMKLSENTVATLIRRAKLHLRKALTFIASK